MMSENESILSAQLEKLLWKEIEILRDLLSTLKQEQNALISWTEEQIDHVLTARLSIFETYERAAKNLVECIYSFAKEQGKMVLPDEKEHQKAIEILEELLPSDDVELHALLDQLKALLEEIQNQHNITRIYLRDRRGTPLPHIGLHHYNLSEKVSPARKKIALELLDPPSRGPLN